MPTQTVYQIIFTCKITCMHCKTHAVVKIYSLTVGHCTTVYM